MTDEPIPEDLTSIADQVRAWSDHTARAMDLPGGDHPLVDASASPVTGPSAPAGTTATEASLAPARGRRRQVALIAAASIAVVAIGAAAFAGLGDDPDGELRVATDPGVTTEVADPPTSGSVSTTSSLDATTTSTGAGSTTSTHVGPPSTLPADVAPPLPTVPGANPQPSTPGSAVPGGPATTTSTTTATPPHPDGGPVSGRLVLPTTTVASGGTIKGTLHVTNANGRDLGYIFCGAVFATGLRNDSATQAIVQPACARFGVLPPGDTTFPVTIRADYGSCTASRAPTPLGVPCDGDRIPGLPPGTYELRIVGPDDLPLTVTIPEITVTG